MHHYGSEYKKMKSRRSLMKRPLSHQLKRREGFTIVELLIVIVVIAILAIIVIISYNGIQARASAVALENTADEYKKGLTNYLIVNGDYPLHNSGMCLGAVSDYPNGCYGTGTANSAAATALKHR
jgi:prepilin-type N-terminal cleavage/methylation domain-containing protein